MEKSLMIVATLLLATVAGQSLDTPLKWNKDGILTLKWIPSDYGGRRLLGHPLEKSLIYGNSLEVPTYLRDDVSGVSLFPFEDVIVQPLFQEYMRLPYFHQYWSYPMFQCYVSSEYFQRFWLLPSFQQYFVNPFLFYKYIFPIVTIFKDDMYTTAHEHHIISLRPYYSPSYGIKQTQDFSEELYHKTLLKNMILHLYNSQRQEMHGNSQEDVQLAPEGDVTEDAVGKIIVNPITTTGDINLTIGDADAKFLEEPMISVENVDENTASETAFPNPTGPILPDNLYNTRAYAPYSYGRVVSSPFVTRMFQG